MGSTRRRLSRTVALFAVVGLVLSALPVLAAKPRTATPFRLKDMNGRTYDLKKELGEKVVVLSFWATWCAPCKAEMTALEEIHRKYEDDGLRILAISIDDPKSADLVKPLVRQRGLTYKVLLDPESRVVTLYNPRKNVPFTAVIDKDGRVVHERLGYEPGAEKELESQVRELLGLPSQATETDDAETETDSPGEPTP